VHYSRDPLVLYLIVVRLASNWLENVNQLNHAKMLKTSITIEYHVLCGTYWSILVFSHACACIATHYNIIKTQIVVVKTFSSIACAPNDRGGESSLILVWL
jgi:hypothetical protein